MDHQDTTAIGQEIESICGLYLALARDLEPETGLGGKLLYAGEPTEAAVRLLRAANIAGAASLAASANAPALLRAMREGGLDFVVNSLDEALRILKNEVRKKQPVAVGITLASEAVAREMVERGVQPDILAPDLPATPHFGAFSARGASIVQPKPLPPGRSFNIFPIPPDGKKSMAAFEAMLLDCLAPEDHVHRRWVRFAPRYLPSAARRLRSIVCDRNAASQLEVRIGTIGCPGFTAG